MLLLRKMKEFPVIKIMLTKSTIFVFGVGKKRVKESDDIELDIDCYFALPIWI
jgi:hypothetical protein